MECILFLSGEECFQRRHHQKGSYGERLLGCPRNGKEATVAAAKFVRGNG